MFDPFTESGYRTSELYQCNVGSLMYYTRSIFVLCGWVKYRSKDSKVKLWNILGFVVLPKITVYLTEYFNTMYNFNMKPELKNFFIPLVGNRKVIGKCMNGSNFEYEIITCFFNWIWYRILNNLHEFDLTRFDCNCMKLENSLLIVWVVHVMKRKFKQWYSTIPASQWKSRSWLWTGTKMW